jgi:hypothetical protein
MLTVRTSIRVDHVTGAEVFDFLANPEDESYRAWWPGTHLQLHIRERGGHDHVGDLIYMDEYVGKRRLRMSAIVTEAVPGRKLVWRLKKGLKLPARLYLELEDYDGGVAITHTIRVGFRGAGRILDPALKLLLSETFARDMDDHARTEFPRLRDLLRHRRAAAGARTTAGTSPPLDA